MQYLVPLFDFPFILTENLPFFIYFFQLTRQLRSAGREATFRIPKSEQLFDGKNRSDVPRRGPVVVCFFSNTFVSMRIFGVYICVGVFTLTLMAGGFRSEGGGGRGAVLTVKKKDDLL